jgi:ribosome biogenesis protein BMS1
MFGFQFRPLTWRLTHPYLVADRFEDVTPEEDIRVDAKCDREVAIFGFLRGANLKLGQRVHLAVRIFPLLANRGPSLMEYSPF